MHEKATVLTTIFTRVDDTMKGSPMIQQTLDRPGPAPRLSESEVVTLAIYQELIGEPREDHFFRLHQEQVRPYFPGLNERSRYNRSIRALWSVILTVRISLQVVLNALELEETAASDSAPVPCMGYKRGKQASDFAGTAEYGVCSSKAYNILFAEKSGSRSAAQIKAFADTWKWDEVAGATYQDVIEAGGRVSEALQAFRQLLGTNDMLAYLVMMAPRLVELRRVLKPTGSIYLHCDPTASHYLKLLMDSGSLWTRVKLNCRVRGGAPAQAN